MAPRGFRGRTCLLAEAVGCGDRGPASAGDHHLRGREDGVAGALDAIGEGQIPIPPRAVSLAPGPARRGPLPVGSPW